ncbi:MAG: hypothetical protein AMXMBFR58_35710 [Phycisphaerae bacterium]|nr:hypothetical protein [Phycisphaerales bacterium]
MNRAVISSITAASVLAMLAANWALGGRPDPRITADTSVPAPACCVDDSNASAGVAIEHTLTLDGAHKVLDAAIAAARERSAGGAIAIVDAGGNAILLERLDGTFPAAASVSLGKARTAAVFRKPTKAFEDAINGGRVALAAVREMTPLQGGVPIMHDGQVIGAVGVSGAHSQNEDEQIAIAGAAALDGSSAQSADSPVSQSNK